MKINMTTDNETTEMWREHRKAGQAKRASNREHAARVLMLNNINFESKNGGAHLIVESGVGKIDFWPGTGLFIPRPTGKRGRGMHNLIKFCAQVAQPAVYTDLTQINWKHADQNTTRTHSDHAHNTRKSEARTAGDNDVPDDASELPWD